MSRRPESRRALAFPIALSCLALVSTLSAAPASARVFDFVENEQVDFDFSTRKGLRLRISEPDIELRIGGRLHTDLVIANDDRTRIQTSDADLRRARLYLSGKIHQDFRFKVDREFAPDRRGWRNVWAGYRINKNVSVRAGNFVAPFGLEDMAASNYSTFMERSVSAALAPSFQTGAIIKTNGRFASRASRHRWTASAAWTMEPLGEASNDRHRNEHHGFVSRFTYAPLAGKRRVLHIGAAAEYRDTSNDESYRIRTRTESGLIPALLNTGVLADVDSAVSVGLEGLILYGPLTIQGEYMQTFLQRSRGRADPSFPGAYLQASYVLTGEHRRYSRSSALLGGVKPKSKWGAVELGLRFSMLDLNDESVNGGSARDWTVGLNWYIRENVRLMFNYVAIDARLRATRQSDKPHIWQGRFQLFF